LKKLFFLILSSILLFSCLNNKKPVKAEEFYCGVEDDKTYNIDSGINQPDVYKRKCASCHLVTKDMTGPKLEGVLDKIPSEKWFELYIKNEDSLLKNGDKYANKISNFSKVNNVHNFNDLTTDEINILKKYIRGKMKLK
jgi:hypothetical protein